MSNYCTKCQSYYSQPGTCNCFAGATPGVSPWAPMQPFIDPTFPWMPSVPYLPDTFGPWTTKTWPVDHDTNGTISIAAES